MRIHNNLEKKVLFYLNLEKLIFKAIFETIRLFAPIYIDEGHVSLNIFLKLILIDIYFSHSSLGIF